MENIFKTINPNENLILANLTANELADFLALIDNYMLDYRTYLGLDPSVTYGLEIECDWLRKKPMQRFLARQNLDYISEEPAWQVTKDFSVPKGGEVTSPILSDSEVCWEQLNLICQYLKKHAKIKKYAAGHVHIGANILNDDTQKLWHFLNLWMTYENIIYRFCYGEYLTPRPRIMGYAMPVADLIRSHYELFQDLVQNNDSIKDLFREICQLFHRDTFKKNCRNEALNFNNVKDFHSFQIRNTIEFRCPNGSINPIIWQNNVNLFVNMLTNGVGALYQEDIIKERERINGRKYNNLNSYSDIYLKQALEFSDLIFARNIDKIYFLKQYLKNNEVSTKILKKAKPFTK